MADLKGDLYPIKQREERDGEFQNELLIQQVCVIHQTKEPVSGATTYYY